ncbi:MAG: glycosyltransferase [Candidatus Woesearchaeota archaeon]
MEDSSIKSPIIMEASWEVCNKVGGIYTVVSSKAYHMVMKHSKDFITVGPFFTDKAATEFVPQNPPEHIKIAIDNLQHKGISCQYGYWHISSKPACILIDYRKMMGSKDSIKGELWERYGIDSMNAGYDYDEPVSWAYCVGMLAEEIEKSSRRTVILHAHEWLTGPALLYCKYNAPNIRTVFTTHATMLGRSISGAWSNLYDILETIDPVKAAYELGVSAKHLTERASAKNADVFTTVSDVTGYEAKYILEKEPDVILPNGLDFANFPDTEQIPIQHKQYLSKIREFLMPYFFPYYSIDLEHSLLLYISGRYEYSNKGIDVFIDALGKINEEMKREETNRTIIVFLFVPADIQNIRYDLLQSKALFEDIQDEIMDYSRKIQSSLISGFAQGKSPDQVDIYDDNFLMKMKRASISFSRQGQPPLSTHHINNEDNDPIISALKRNGLLNDEQDRVKIVFYPGYLSASDGLLNLDYYPAVTGCHLGVFPSSYEPWGYTPLESAGYGVPAITTDLAGLGAHIIDNNIDQEGLWVLERKSKEYNHIVDELKKLIDNYATLPHEKRLEKKQRAIKTSRLFDWKILIKHYETAYEKALRR